MKKIVSLLLTLLLLISCSACAEMHDLLFETEQNGLTYCVRGSDNRAMQLVVKDGEHVLWSQSVSVDASVGNLNNRYGIGIDDLNFDGYDDVMIATSVDGDLISYACFLRDGKKNTFVYSESLSRLKTIGVKASIKAIFGLTQEREELSGNAYSHCDKITKYVWEGGKLSPEMYASVTYHSKHDNYRYSVAYYDVELKKFEDSKDVWLTPEEYAATDWSFLYYFKQKNHGLRTFTAHDFLYQQIADARKRILRIG